MFTVELISAGSAPAKTARTAIIFFQHQGKIKFLDIMPAYNISKVLEKTASTILDYVQNIQKQRKREC